MTFALLLTGFVLLSMRTTQALSTSRETRVLPDSATQRVLSSLGLASADSVSNPQISRITADSTWFLVNLCKQLTGMNPSVLRYRDIAFSLQPSSRQTVPNKHFSMTVYCDSVGNLIAAELTSTKGTNSKILDSARATARATASLFGAELNIPEHPPTVSLLSALDRLLPNRIDEPQAIVSLCMSFTHHGKGKAPAWLAESCTKTGWVIAFVSADSPSAHGSIISEGYLVDSETGEIVAIYTKGKGEYPYSHARPHHDIISPKVDTK